MLKWSNVILLLLHKYTVILPIKEWSMAQPLGCLGTPRCSVLGLIVEVVPTLTVGCWAIPNSEMLGHP